MRITRCCHCISKYWNLKSWFKIIKNWWFHLADLRASYIKNIRMMLELPILIAILHKSYRDLICKSNLEQMISNLHCLKLIVIWFYPKLISVVSSKVIWRKCCMTWVHDEVKLDYTQVTDFWQTATCSCYHHVHYSIYSQNVLRFVVLHGLMTQAKLV